MATKRSPSMGRHQVGAFRSFRLRIILAHHPGKQRGQGLMQSHHPKHGVDFCRALRWRFEPRKGRASISAPLP